MSVAWGSEEFARNVEADEPRVAAHAAVDQLPERRPGTVRDVDLKGVTPRSRLEAEAALMHARFVAAEARRHFTHQIGRRSNPDARAETEQRRVVVDAAAAVG